MIYNKKRGAREAWAQMAWLATSGTQEGRIAHHSLRKLFASVVACFCLHHSSCRRIPATY